MDQSPPEEVGQKKDWADAVADAASHAKKSVAAAEVRVEPRDRRLPILLAAGVVFLIVTAWSAYRLTTPPGPLSQVEQAADLREEAAVLVQEVEAYRAAFGRLPDPQHFAGLLDEDFTYQITDPVAGLYLVTRSGGDVTVRYDGSMPIGLWVLVGGTNPGGA